MGLMWTIVGLLAGLSVLFYRELVLRFRVRPLGWAGLLLGEFMILFAIAWSVGSFAEGVPQAAAMGIMMFGGSGLILLVLTWRFLIVRQPKSG